MAYGAIGTAANTWTGTGGTGDAWNPEIWSKEVQVAAESNLVAGRLCKRVDALVKGGGDVFHLPVVANKAAAVSRALGGVSSAITIDAATPTFVTLNINSRYYAAFGIEDGLSIQAKNFRIDEEKKKAIYSLAKQVDTSVLALYSSLTPSAVGTDNVDPTVDDYLAAIKALDDNDVPETERFFVMSPATKSAFSKITNFISRDFVADMPVKTGVLGERYGVSLYWTTNLPTVTTGKANILMHREAFVLGIQKEISMELQRLLEYFTDLYAGQVVYGTTVYRAGFGVAVYGKA